MTFTDGAWYSPVDSLDVAWAEAQAAMPEGWRWMHLAWRPDAALELNGQDESKRWDAAIWHPGTDAKPIAGRGPTPAAALRALVSQLRGTP